MSSKVRPQPKFDGRALAAVLRETSQPLSLETVDIGPLQPHEVLVKLASSGICHTDLSVMAAPREGLTPIVLGHEGAGVVEHVGAAVETLSPGDHVAMSYEYCRDCDNCAAGLPVHCRNGNALNFVGVRLDGTSALSSNRRPVHAHFFGQSSWSTYAVASANNCVLVDADIPLRIVGPLGCCIQSGAGAVLKTLRPEPGSGIAIFGLGSVGLAALLAAVSAECSTVVAVDLSDARLATAGELGATHTINSSKTDAAQAIRDITGGRGVQYSVDCVGAGSVVRSALECLQSPGVCATVGFQGPGNEITIDQGHLLFGRSLVGVIEGDATPNSFVPEMIALYRRGKFPFDTARANICWWHLCVLMEIEFR